MSILLGWTAIARGADCPEGQAALDGSCIALAGEVIAAVPPEVLKAVWSLVTSSDAVKTCVAPWAGQPDARLDVTAEVAGGRASGIVVSSPRPAPGEVEACVALEVGRLGFPPEPASYRVTVPLVLDEPR